MREKYFDYLTKVFVILLGLIGLWWLLHSVFRIENTNNSRCEMAEKCPNIVLVILDDMPWDHFGFMSDGLVKTPHIDELAARGFVFTHAYNTNSRCRPSLATLATGKLPHQNQIYANHGVLALLDKQALPIKLRDAGYATFAGGKIWDDNAESMGYVESDLDTLHFVRKTQEKLEQFLKKYANRQPVFVWWAPLLPHRTHNPPERFIKSVDPASINIPHSIPASGQAEYREQERAFLATIAWVDEAVGDLIYMLDKNQILKNTWIVIMVDNGWSNAYISKGSPYDIGVRTPVIVVGPDAVVMTSNALISTQNIYGSLLRLAGIFEEPGRQVSLDIISAAKDPSQLLTYPGKEVFWASYPGYTGKSEPDPRAERDVYALSLREGNWQYTFYLKSYSESWDDIHHPPMIIHTGIGGNYAFSPGDEELFDLEKDPFSQKNLAYLKENNEKNIRFRKKLFQWWTETGGVLMDDLKRCHDRSSDNLCRKYMEIY